jgi:hypothetical protein
LQAYIVCTGLVKEIVKPADNFSVPVEPNKWCWIRYHQIHVAKPLEAPDWKLNSANNRYPRTLDGKSQYGLQPTVPLPEELFCMMMEKFL